MLLHSWDDDESSGAAAIGVFSNGASAIAAMIHELQADIKELNPEPESVYGRSGAVGIKDGCCDYRWWIEEKEVT